MAKVYAPVSAALWAALERLHSHLERLLFAGGRSKWTDSFRSKGDLRSSSYAVSFSVIGAIWINHHTMFDHMVRADHRLLLLNTFHLMFIAFMPFSTAVLARALHDGANAQLPPAANEL